MYFRLVLSLPIVIMSENLKDDKSEFDEQVDVVYF